MSKNRSYLIELDGIVGDHDLDLTMSDGFKTAVADLFIKGYADFILGVDEKNV